MKLRHSALALSFATLLAAPVFADALSDAQAAYVRGDYPAAKAKFEEVLKADPKNPLAKNYLRLINATKPKVAANKPPEALAALRLPKVEFKDATFSAALDYFKKRVAELTKDEQKINFVVQLPPEAADKIKVTLALSDIPFPEALRYLGDLANVTFTYDPHAIVVKQKSAALKGGSTDELVNEPQ